MLKDDEGLLLAESGFRNFHDFFTSCPCSITKKKNPFFFSIWQQNGSCDFILWRFGDVHDFFQVNPRARLILTPHSQKLLGNTGSIKCPNLKYVYSKGYDYYQIILCKCFKLPKVSIQQNKHPPPFFLPKRKRIKRKD